MIAAIQKGSLAAHSSRPSPEADQRLDRYRRAEDPRVGAVRCRERAGETLRRTRSGDGRRAASPDLVRVFWLQRPVERRAARFAADVLPAGQKQVSARHLGGLHVTAGAFGKVSPRLVAGFSRRRHPILPLPPSAAEASSPDFRPMGKKEARLA